MKISNLILGAFLTILLLGCATSQPSSSTKLVKLPADSKRDTELARELNRKAAAFIEKSDFSGAEKLLKTAIDADPEFGPAQNNLGVVYFNQSKLYAAAQQFLLAAALMPRDPEPRNGLGLVFESSNRFDDAINYYDRARVLDPSNVEYLGNSARAHVRRGDRSEELRGLLSSVAASDPRPEWNRWARDTIRQLERSVTTAPDRPSENN